MPGRWIRPQGMDASEQERRFSKEALASHQGASQIWRNKDLRRLKSIAPLGVAVVTSGDEIVSPGFLG